MYDIGFVIVNKPSAVRSIKLDMINFSVEGVPDKIGSIYMAASIRFVPSELAVYGVETCIVINCDCYSQLKRSHL